MIIKTAFFRMHQKTLVTIVHQLFHLQKRKHMIKITGYKVVAVFKPASDGNLELLKTILRISSCDLRSSFNTVVFAITLLISHFFILILSKILTIYLSG